MPPPRVLIVTPAPPGSRAGNRNTAVRWMHILRDLGCRVVIDTQWDGSSCDILIALHARKSHRALADFRRRHPDRPAVLALTGTDIYRDICEDAAAAASLDLADRLIVLQQEALEALTPAQRRKARVIHQSVATALTPSPPSRRYRICQLGHLREEKDPFRIVAALRLLPGEALDVVHAGAALTPDMAREAKRLMRGEPRYRWIGELPHWQSMRLLARSHAMLIGSRMEGGAHVVSEAIALGVPVIASDIPGNRGLLGADYPALYEMGNAAALAEMIRRTIHEPRFLQSLAAAVKRRRALVEPRREREAWKALLGELGYLRSSRAARSSRTGR